MPPKLPFLQILFARCNLAPVPPLRGSVLMNKVNKRAEKTVFNHAFSNILVANEDELGGGNYYLPFYYAAQVNIEYYPAVREKEILN